MITQASALDPAQYAVQYELLRSQVIGARGDLTPASGAGQPRGVGLALLLRDGIPAWLKAIEAVIRASLVPRTADVTPPASVRLVGHSEAPTWLSNVQRQDITTLLASLVLSTRSLQRSSQKEGYQPCH